MKMYNKGYKMWWSLLVILLGTMTTLSAQNSSQSVSFTVDAPHAVESGTQFNVTFTLNANGSNFRMENPSGIDILYGPQLGQSARTTIINGNISSSTFSTYTYVMSVQKPGKYTIPAASVQVGRSTYHTQPYQIEVVAGQGGSRNPQGNNQPVAQPSSKLDAFIRVIVSKSKVYEQEGLLVSFKLYSNNDFDFKDVKFPSFDGFLTQDIPQPDILNVNMENYKGKVYRTVVLRQYYLFPQHSGTLIIPEGEYHMTFNIPLPSSGESLFDDFFGQSRTVDKTLYSPATHIIVKPLPTPKPAGFTGAVGEFSLHVDKPNPIVKANESYTLGLILKGTGNVKLAQVPKPDFPNSFDLFDPKDSVKINVTPSGVTGTKKVEYYTVPRAQGDFTIPPISFSYFDPTSATYKTIASESIKVHVDKGDATPQASVSNYTDKQSVRYLAQDIHYIKKSGASATTLVKSHLNIYLMIYLGLFVLALIIYLVMSRLLREQADVIGSRRRKAGKMAKRWLKVAMQNRDSGDHSAYFEALLKGLTDYISDKFHLPLSSMSKDNIKDTLDRYGVSEETIASVLRVISDLEMARYAPTGEYEEKDLLFDKSAEVIEQLENIKIKK